MSEQFELIRQMMVSMVSDVASGVVAFTPKLVGALVVLLLGWLLAKLVQVMVSRALGAGLDAVMERAGLAQALERSALTSTPSDIVGRVLFWLIVIGFVMAAAEVLGLTAVTAAISRIFAYVPSVVSAALVLAAGVFLARLVGQLVQSAAEAADLTYARGLSAVARSAIVVMVGVVTVEQLGVDTQIVVTVITVSVAALTAGMALAFALGSREVVRGILAGHYLRQSLDEGTSVEVNGQRGVLEQIGPVYSVFRDGAHTFRVPNRRLMDENLRS